MPLYEYRCGACEHQFEVIQSYSDKPIRKCEKCGGKVSKLVSRSGFILKGGGWFKQDYSNAPASKSKDGGSSGEGSSESAPASKPESGSRSGDSAGGAPAAAPAPASSPSKGDGKKSSSRKGTPSGGG